MLERTKNFPEMVGVNSAFFYRYVFSSFERLQFMMLCSVRAWVNPVLLILGKT